MEVPASSLAAVLLSLGLLVETVRMYVPAVRSTVRALPTIVRAVPDAVPAITRTPVPAIAILLLVVRAVLSLEEVAAALTVVRL